MSENKYHRRIFSAIDGEAVTADVYEVLLAFEVTCPATGHAIKKLLCAGLREKGSRLQDLQEAAEALQRAIEFEERIVGQELGAGNVSENECDACCPKCGSPSIEQTCIGFLGRDENRATCCECGWQGVVDDLELRHT